MEQFHEAVYNENAYRCVYRNVEEITATWIFTAMYGEKV